MTEGVYVKKALDEREQRLNEKLKELDKREKELKRSNKLKYGPGNRAEMIGLTVFACMIITILGVYMVQQYLNEDEEIAAGGGTTSYQTSRSTSSVSTGGSAAQPVEIYPDDKIDDAPEPPSDDPPAADGYAASGTPEGGFGYSGIALPSAPAITTISAHEIQIGGDGFVVDGLGGGFNELDGLLPQYTDSVGGGTATESSARDGSDDTVESADAPEGTETLSTGGTDDHSDGNEPVQAGDAPVNEVDPPVYDVTESVATTTASAVTVATPPRGEALYVDPESEMGHNAQEFFG